MIESIVSQVVVHASGQVVSYDLKSKLENYIIERNNDIIWNSIVQETIAATEGIDEEIVKYVFRQLPIVDLKRQLFDKVHENIYRKFVLSLAMELCKFNKEKEFAVSLGTAIVDNWFKKNKYPLDFDGFDVQDFCQLINNREKLYRNYFKLFEDKNGIDKIRIFYPKNGESWIRWDEKYSIDINVNLSKGLAYGFCRAGFDYYKNICDKDYKTLKYAYIVNEKEILRFNDFSWGENNIIIWIR